MILCYLDTSAAMKLLVNEAESSAIAELVASQTFARLLVSSWLLHTELHCAARRRSDQITERNLVGVLDLVLLNDLLRADLRQAVTYAGLRTNDAIHLATAIRVGAAQMLAYDTELLRAAAAQGIEPLSPGVAAR